MSNPSGSTTISRAASRVSSAASVLRPLNQRDSQRYQGANSKAMIAPHMMAPWNGSNIQPKANETANSSNSKDRFSSRPGRRGSGRGGDGIGPHNIARQTHAMA